MKKNYLIIFCENYNLMKLCSHYQNILS